MANLKAIRKRIVGVKGTQQLTRAMKLVAAAKLRKAQEAATSLRPYAEGIHDTIVHLAQRLDPQAHPLLSRREPKKVLLLVYSSDRGMCGSFNLNVSREAEEFIAERKKNGIDVTVAVIGKKGHEFFRRGGHEILHYYDDMFADISYDSIAEIGDELSDEYLGGDYDELYVAYNWFRSAVLQEVTISQVLPVDLDSAESGNDEDETNDGIPHLFEPNRGAILDELFPQYVNMELYHALLESVASEMGARMTAMDNATNNADDLIRRLTLQYNKARQETITTELMDIVGGAEAIS